jgi:hypothetical protein
MSELLLRLAGDATVRGTITSDGEYVGSVYNFINLACNKRGRFAYKVWERLISENSVYKDELYKLFTVEYVKGLSGQIDDLSHTKKTRLRQTPVMTLRGREAFHEVCVCTKPCVYVIFITSRPLLFMTCRCSLGVRFHQPGLSDTLFLLNRRDQ